MKILIFAGAGASVELGVPAMPGLASEFQSHCLQWNIAPSQVQDMLGDSHDVETLIEGLDNIANAGNVLETLGTNLPLEKIYTIRSEVEWFVQNAAEKVSPNDAHLMWGSVLRATRSHSPTFVTTNYDRAIELAANAEGISLDDGFEPFTVNEAARWVDFQQDDSTPRVAKLHGSTDWYSHVQTGDPRKLRHPMPLFGRATLRLPGDVELGTAMVLPSREKRLNKAPYPRMVHAFLSAVDACDFAIFVGSSFRDANVRDESVKISQDRAVFIVNRTGNCHGIELAQPIAQPASQFLISTLPAALLDSDPIKSLMSARAATDESLDVLQLLRIATDTFEQSERRCSAIEQLDQASLTLDQHLVGKLLADKDATVSRFALGLVATSPDRRDLLSVARDSPHKSDFAYSDELDLLGKIINA